MIDSNRPGGKEGPLHRTFESDDIADFIWESLAEHVGGEPQCLIDLQLLCNKKDHPEIKKAMDPWINSGNDAMFADKKLEILTIEEKSALLTLATRVGDIKAIQALLKFKPTVGPSFVDERYLQFDSPLTVAIRFGHAEVVKLLLDSGASLNTGAHHEAFLWQQAITHDRIDILRMLLNHPLSTQNFSRVQTRPPLLNFIAKHGDTDLMSRLLQNRTIDPNFQPHNGDTPLHCAALNGQLDTVKLLMRDPQINPNLNDYYGNTAFHLAQIKASYAKEVAEKQRFIEIAEAIKNHPKFIESMHSDGSPLLHYHIERHTAGSDLTEIIRLISDGDYPRNERDKEGHSALFYALQKDPDLSVDLVRSGFEINEIDSISEKHILAMALYSGFDNVFAVALERLSRDKKAFDINYRSDDDRGFLQYALDCGNYAIANLILTHEVELVFSDFAWTDPKGKSVLHLSMFHMSDLSAEKIIKKMRELNLPLDRRDKLNNTAFFYAIQEKKMDGAKLIMDSCEGSQVLYSELARLLSVIQSYSWERSNKPLAMALDMFKVMTTFRELYLKEGDQILTNHPYSSLAPVAPTLKILSELASISFDPLKLPQSNDSLLHQAIATENIELLDMLLENEIIKNELMQSSHPVNTDNKSPLEVALQMKSPIIVIKLIKAGASFVEAFEDATYETCGHLEELSLALKNDDKVVKEEVIKAAEMIDARYDLKIKELILDHNQIAPETERVGIRDVKKF